MSENTLTKKFFFFFPCCETEKPIVYHLVKDYNLMVNIFRAKVTPAEEGYLVLDITGTEENIKRGLEYIKSFNVTVNEQSIGLRWDRERCTHCGNCLTHCPTHALYLADLRTREVSFNPAQCIECLNCLECCPYKACSSIF